MPQENKEQLRKKFEVFCEEAAMLPYENIFDFFYSEIEERDRDILQLSNYENMSLLLAESIIEKDKEIALLKKSIDATTTKQ